MSHDLVIRHGNIVDGTGGVAFVGDVAVDGDVITEVGSVSGKGARPGPPAEGHLAVDGGDVRRPESP